MPEPSGSPDPFAMWRDWLSHSERQWNSFLNDVMATDEFSQGMGRMMDVYLNMQKNMNEVMSRYLAFVNVPTRTDVLSLGNRLSEIEERLVSIEDSLRAPPPAARPIDAQAPEPAAVARPARTRKPPE